MDRQAFIDWPTYLETFHATSPGITEDVLSASLSRSGLTPYEWVVAPVGARRTVLDLACGSGPSMDVAKGIFWVGLDYSVQELNRARMAGRGPLVRADASHLPFREESFDAVVCSMALMLLQPLRRSIEEVTRVMKDDALMVVLMPGRRPLGVRDVFRYLRLVRRLGRWRLHYPNDREIRGLSSMLDNAGLDVVADTRERFSFALLRSAETEKFVQSLYLPEVTPLQVQRGLALTSRWTGTDIGIPLRRIVARKRAASLTSAL